MCCRGSIYLGVLLACLGLLSTNTYADKQTDKTRLLMEKSGLVTTINTVFPGVLKALKKEGKHLPRGVFKEVHQKAREVYNPKQMYEQVYEKIEGKFSLTTTETVMAWLDSNLGKVITQAEKLGSRPESKDLALQYRRSAVGKEIKPNRLALFKRLDAASKTTENTVKITLATSLGVKIALDAQNPFEKRQGREKIRLALFENTEPLNKIIGQYVLDSFHYTYRKVGDEGLKRYVEFVESDAGHFFNVVILDALNEVLLETGIRFGEEMTYIIIKARDNARSV